jgi:hypothetical protein
MSIDDIMELVAAAERAYAEASAASAGTAHEVAHEEARAAVREAIAQLVEDERVDAASEENDAMRAHIHEHGSGGL